MPICSEGTFPQIMFKCGEPILDQKGEKVIRHMGKKYNPNKCPVSKKISESIVRLPFFNDLDISSIDFKIFYEF